MPPEVNLLNEKNNGSIVLKLISSGIINSIHDVSTGGIILALAEMSISSQIGIKIDKPKKHSNLGFSLYYFTCNPIRRAHRTIHISRKF